MGLLLPACVLIAILFELVAAAPMDYYASKYDHLDVETLLNNRRMVSYYADCILSKGPCPPQGLEFKRILPEALKSTCQRCTEKQKTVTLRAIKRLKKEYPKVWAQLEQQWDPDGSYVKKFEDSFNNIRPSESTPEASVQILNRFGDETTNGNSIDNAISQVFTSSTTPSSTTPTTKITTASTTITTKASTVSTVSTTSKISTKVTTTKPTINTFAATTKPTKRPRPNIGASIQATVSLGPNIVGDLVRGLGALGTRVVETGAEIAGVVLKNIARPL